MIMLWAPRMGAIIAVLLATAGCTLLNDLGSYPAAPANDAGAGQDKPEDPSVVADPPGDGGPEDLSSDRAADEVDAEETDAVDVTASPDSSLGGPEVPGADDLPVEEANPGDGGMESEASADGPVMVDASDGPGSDGAGSNEIGSAPATVMTFEDLFVEPDFWDAERTTSGIRPVPRSYAGFQWNSAAAVINRESNGARGSAYGWGTIGTMSLFTRNGADLSFSGPAFDFTGAYLTAHAEKPIAMTVRAFRGSVIVHSETLAITPWPDPDTDIPYFYTFNFRNVDAVTFVTGGNQWFVIDNITISGATSVR